MHATPHDTLTREERNKNDDDASQKLLAEELNTQSFQQKREACVSLEGGIWKCQSLPRPLTKFFPRVHLLHFSIHIMQKHVHHTRSFPVPRHHRGGEHRRHPPRHLRQIPFRCPTLSRKTRWEDSSAPTCRLCCLAGMPSWENTKVRSLTR